MKYHKNDQKYRMPPQIIQSIYSKFSPPRFDIWQKLVKRNQQVSLKFRHLEYAISKSSWVKKASMQVLRYERKSTWGGCQVELEQGAESNRSTLTINYTVNRYTLTLLLIIK